MVAFGRHPQFDERSRAFGIRDLLPTAPLVSKSWTCTTYLDQGDLGSCVGHGFAHYLASSPHRELNITEQRALSIYSQATHLDNIAGSYPPQDTGSTVLAGAKAVAAAGGITSYRWAFGITDVLDALSHHGPVVLGINWYEGMMHPTNGYITPTNEIVGGHCILATGIAVTRGYVRLHQSWGKGWGLNGDCRIRFNDLATLLAQQGEACVPSR